MSFYPQPNKYQCGPFALKYALVMLGVFKDEKQISITAGSTWWAGTDEIGLAKAAKKFNCSMKHFTSDNAEEARRKLNNHLLKGKPCIISVDNWEHWVTVVKYSKGRYVMIDSGQNNKVISVKTGNSLSKYWRYYDGEEDYTSYDGYALYPKFKVYTKADLGLQRAREVMFKKNESLARKWDQYFNDLITICKPRTKLMTNYISFAEFLRRNESNLIKKVGNWHGIPSYAELKRILYNMKFVAGVYDLMIHTDDEKKALIDITSLLMMYACGKYGMDPIY